MSSDNRAEYISAILSSLRTKGIDEACIVRVESIIAKASLRPLRVLFECSANDGISTEELTRKYGYNQPPRAARDLKELGFDVRKKPGVTADGRRMVIYYIENFDVAGATVGRSAFTKREKSALLARDGERCFYCRGSFRPSELQIDHRVPFEVAGNQLHKCLGIGALVLACCTCNRSKSWSCEGCKNFKTKSLDVCSTCYWNEPDSYEHVAERAVVRINVVFSEGEIGYTRFRLMDRDAIRKRLES